MDIFWNIVSLVGLLIVLKPIFMILASIYHHIKPMPKLLQRYGKNSWAIVTGATDGIGYGFCEELASLGFNICLISRNLEKLNDKVQLLKKSVNQDVEYKTIAADFVNSSNLSFFDKIKKQIEGLNISILVNNVGIADVETLNNQKQESIYNIINVNCYPMAILSRQIATAMKKRNTKYRNGIINISSYSCIIPMPYMAVYAATKAYNDVFSQAIGREFKEMDDKIDVLSVRAMMVQSGSLKCDKSLTVPTSRECANGSLRYLGSILTTAGHLKHQIIANITDALPSFVTQWISIKESRKVYQQIYPNVKKQL